jgi:hypothetical protein
MANRRASKSKRKAGRPKFSTKLNKSRLEAFLTCILEGGWFAASCYACGFTPQSGYNWLERGEENAKAIENGEKMPYPRIYLDFFEGFKYAEARAGLDAAAELRQAGKAGDAKYSLEYLKRRHAAEWGDKKPEVATADVTVNAILIQIANDIRVKQLAKVGESAAPLPLPNLPSPEVE